MICCNEKCGVTHSPLRQFNIDETELHTFNNNELQQLTWISWAICSRTCCLNSTSNSIGLQESDCSNLTLMSSTGQLLLSHLSQTPGSHTEQSCSHRNTKGVTPYTTLNSEEFITSKRPQYLVLPRQMMISTQKISIDYSPHNLTQEV